MSEEDLKSLYARRSQIGCNPIWILIAYGNTEVLKRAIDLGRGAGIDVKGLASVENNQGDTAVLATSSLGNLTMVKFLTESVFTAEEMSSLLEE